MGRQLPIVEPASRRRAHAWAELVAVHSSVCRAITVVLAECGMTLPQFDLLATLRFNTGITQNDLAARLLVTKGNVTGLIDRLEASGWVSRKPDPTDGRANRLHLTPAGKRKIDAVLPKHDAAVDSLLSGLDGTSLDEFRSALHRLGRGIET